MEEQARSVLRERFYRFASSEVGRGYVHETEGSFDAFFPQLPKNTDEMRLTALYTETAYPVTMDSSGSPVMHAWAGCPQAGGATARGSIAQMEAGGYAMCRPRGSRCEHGQGGGRIHLHRKRFRIPLRRGRPGGRRLPESPGAS